MPKPLSQASAHSIDVPNSNHRNGQGGGKAQDGGPGERAAITLSTNSELREQIEPPAGRVLSNLCQGNANIGCGFCP
jgi:hypothetical protein